LKAHLLHRPRRLEFTTTTTSPPPPPPPHHLTRFRPRPRAHALRRQRRTTGRDPSRVARVRVCNCEKTSVICDVVSPLEPPRRATTLERRSKGDVCIGLCR
uniref:Bursicon subunit alpha n=1 Tax=Heligmosomoides polygyrus TaxID=6339 RepID=A0A183FZT3_HELPZ